MRFFRLLILFVALAAIIGGGVMWYLAGREAGPAITINAPAKFVGRSTALSVTIDSPTPLTSTSVTVTQNGKAVTLNDVKNNTQGNKTITTATIGRDGLANGPATLSVEASRQTLFGLRTAASEASRELMVRLDPPRIAAISSHHFINLGGAEFVVLRATPDDVEAGI